MNATIYVVTAVDYGDTCDGKARTLGAYTSEAEAGKNLADDMAAHLKALGPAYKELDQGIVDAETGEPKCEWNIEPVKVDVPCGKAFAEAVERAYNVLCGDREGTFTCHTVDPYVQGMAEAHAQETLALREEADHLRALLRGLRKIVRGVPVESLDTTPWVTQGALVYPKGESVDYGDLVATFEDIDGVVATEAVCAVNAFMELREHLDRFFREPEPEGAQ